MEFKSATFIISAFLTCLLFYQNDNDLPFISDEWREDLFGSNRILNKPTWDSARERFLQRIEALKMEFPNQSVNTWLKIQATIVNTLQYKEPIHPSVITILASSNITSRFLKCFTKKLASELNKSVYPLLTKANLMFGFPGHIKEIYPNTFQKHSITFIRSDIERYFKSQGKALIVHDITNFKREEDLMVFHGICDNYHAVDVRATILFPIRIPTSLYENLEPSLASTANMILTKAWSKILEEDSVPALVARVADTVILLEKEDDCSDNRIYQDFEPNQSETNNSHSMPAFQLNNNDHLSCFNALPFQFTRNKNVRVQSTPPSLNFTSTHSKLNLDSTPVNPQNKTVTNENILYDAKLPHKVYLTDIGNASSHTKQKAVKMEQNLTSTEEENKNDKNASPENQSTVVNTLFNSNSPAKRNETQDFNQQPHHKSELPTLENQNNPNVLESTIFKPIIEGQGHHAQVTSKKFSKTTNLETNDKRNIPKRGKKPKIPSSTTKPTQHVNLPKSNNKKETAKLVKRRENVPVKYDKKLKTDGSFSKVQFTKQNKKPFNGKKYKKSNEFNKHQKPSNSKRKDKKSKNHKNSKPKKSSKSNK